MRFFRIAIPVVIVVALGLTWFVSWLDPLKVMAKLPIDGTLVIKGTKITMEAPKLSGYTRDQRWYELNAAGATQDITKPDIVELQEVRAKVEAEDKKSTMFLSAKDGTFNRKANVLTLNNNISLKSSTGYEIRLDEAVVDTTSGEVVSNKPVEVTLAQQGTLKSERLEVLKSGEVVRFTGNVIMNLVGLPDNPATAEKR